MQVDVLSTFTLNITVQHRMSEFWKLDLNKDAFLTEPDFAHKVFVCGKLLSVVVHSAFWVPVLLLVPCSRHHVWAQLSLSPYAAQEAQQPRGGCLRQARHKQGWSCEHPGVLCWLPRSGKTRMRIYSTVWLVSSFPFNLLSCCAHIATRLGVCCARLRWGCLMP